ncbi:anhydro-N-acetylmuramic acid kinase [Paucihalobacter ruber]|uniref:Anhydro-N-acetylmuramic acid kinase n=1 Tax=Paucihalobacter ruber TaxID=2567861 RepID=A0A506PK90_9FLAO|nr:anhydro-N-acetylmuramic acid kinase [Paucihalobacter ruber]TPV34233.1 anhydro-N-acetylmuramic acid kinase [Paucihalobacter ruber]
MLRNEYFVIGVMSGTSLDGIDLAYVHFTLNKQWQFEIIHAQTIPYPKEWTNILTNLAKDTIEKIIEIDPRYTNYLGSVINQFISTFNISRIDFIASHGHTALHQPEKGLTYQIGNLEQLSQLLKCTVICDFRTNDVKLGGQGAPLVPIGDRLLFSGYDYCLNLGGFSNISFEFNGERKAFDICPVNTVLNFYANKLGFEFDMNGELSRAGKVKKTLLQELNSLEYYTQPFPKSLGIEYVNNSVLPLIDGYQIDVMDILRTFTEHIAVQVAKQISFKINSKVLVTGGGTKNKFLLDRLRFYSLNEIVVPSNQIIDFKEALIFAFLGVLRFRDEINCLKSVTGANIDHSSGKIYFLK